MKKLKHNAVRMVAVIAALLVFPCCDKGDVVLSIDEGLYVALDPPHTIVYRPDIEATGIIIVQDSTEFYPDNPSMPVTQGYLVTGDRPNGFNIGDTIKVRATIKSVYIAANCDADNRNIYKILSIKRRK